MVDWHFIYNEYKNFLDKNNLFDPAWIEDTELSDKKANFIIIYPELLQDFSDYEQILAKEENVTLYTFPKDIPAPKAYLYSDSRKELRQTMLQIIQLVNEGKADWWEIALSIPDIDTYRPYIEREFNLYKIPYVIKSGNKLTKNCAGRIFKEIADCYNSNFTFDSVRSLLLDECVPWKEELKQKKEDLIREGNIMRCVCSPFEKDIWRVALQDKINRLEFHKADEKDISYYKELLEFYNNIRNSIIQFFNSNFNTFENILRCWNSFKGKFLLDKEHFSEESNNILSRCVKELEEIINIERKYKDCNLQLESPYQFFLETIDGKTYTPQTKATGVNIYKYKLSAAANVKFQFVIDGSQKNLEINYKRLSFLNTTKRSKLHLLEDDKTLNATEVFMKLYAKQTKGADENFVHFSAATDSFAGFAIPHSLLEYTKDVPDLDKFDYVKKEQEYIKTKGKNPELISMLTPEQKQMFEGWKNSAINPSESFSLTEKLQKLLEYKKNAENGKVNISARGDLEKFFPCPRKWLYSSILKLQDDTLDTSLMKSFDMGNLNHKILELFMSYFKEKQLPFFDSEKKQFMQIQKTEGQLIGEPVDITNEINILLQSELIEKAIKAKSDFRDSPLVIDTLTKQKDQIQKNMCQFFQTLLKPFPEGIGNCTVKGLEESYSAEKEKFNYYGRIDSLLETPDGDLIIIDYKNTKGSMPEVKELKVDENGILHDFQMPLYNQLISANSIKEIFGMYYYGIKDSEKRTPYEQEKPKATPEEYQETLKALEDYATMFEETFTEHKLEPVQSKDNNRLNVKTYDHCINCTFKSICRTTYAVAGKEISKGETNE